MFYKTVIISIGVSIYLTKKIENTLYYPYMIYQNEQSPYFQRNQGTKFLGRFSLKVGRFDILLMKCCILDNFSYNVMQKGQKKDNLGLSWAKLSSDWDLTLLKFFKNLLSLNPALERKKIIGPEEMPILVWGQRKHPKTKMGST